MATGSIAARDVPLNPRYEAAKHGEDARCDDGIEPSNNSDFCGEHDAVDTADNCKTATEAAPCEQSPRQRIELCGRMHMAPSAVHV